VPSSSDRDRNGSSLTGRMSRRALQPLHAVAHAGRGALVDEAERAIDGILAGPIPETLGRSLVENRVVERLATAALRASAAGGGGPEEALARVDALVARALDDPVLRRTLARAVDADITTELVDALAGSPAFKRLLARVVEAPEVRHALQRQTAGLGADVVNGLRSRAERLDGSSEAVTRRRLHRPPADEPTQRYAGVATRGIALGADAIFANLLFLLVGALCGLFASLFGPLRPMWLVDALAGAGWTLLLAVYFAGFWTAAGQTPGMRLMRLRVVDGSDAHPSGLRSLVRLVGLALAIIPLGAGFLPVLVDDRRRALQDYLAGTAVVHAPDDY